MRLAGELFAVSVVVWLRFERVNENIREKKPSVVYLFIYGPSLDMCLSLLNRPYLIVAHIFNPVISYLNAQ